MLQFINWVTGPAAPIMGTILSSLGILGSLVQRRYADLIYWAGSLLIFVSMLMRLAR